MKIFETHAPIAKTTTAWSKLAKTDMLFLNRMFDKLPSDFQQGEPLCIFYSRYGICKFGPSCKFDHPMGVFSYNFSPTSTDTQTDRHLLASSSGTPALNITSEGPIEGVSVNSKPITE